MSVEPVRRRAARPSTAINADTSGWAKAGERELYRTAGIAQGYLYACRVGGSGKAWTWSVERWPRGSSERERLARGTARWKRQAQHFAMNEARVHQRTADIAATRGMGL